MPEEVKYEMSLNDLVSPKLQQAEGHAQKFESTLGKIHSGLKNLGERAVRVGETLGISFAFYKLEEFFKDGTELVHKFDIAEGQLQNTLKNTGERAGLTAEQLIDMAKRTQHEIPFTTDKIVDMENALSRFGNMTPVVFQKVLTTSADIATALKRDGTDIANTLGRIMEKPAENGRLLRQLNITLSAGQRKYLMLLEQTGHTAKAQTLIFEELAKKGYGGAAKAAADSDPLFRYNKAIYELKMQVGQAGIAIEHAFAPALEHLSGLLSDTVTWVGNNKDMLIDLAGAVAGAAIAYGSYLAVIRAVTIWEAAQNGYMVVYNTLSELQVAFTMARAEGLEVLTAAQWALNVAMDANPIGAILVGVGALVGLLATAFGFWKGMFGGKEKKFEIQHTYNANVNSPDYQDAKNNLGEYSDTVGAAAGHTATFSKSLIDGSKNIIEGTNNVKKAAFNVFEFLKNRPGPDGKFNLNSFLTQSAEKQAAQHRADVAQFDRDLAYIDKHGWAAYEKTQHVNDHKGIKGKKDGAISWPTTNMGANSKVTGSRNVTITIHIQDLVKELKIQTTNFKEGVGKAQEMVARALTSAVNDSQIIGGQ